MATPKGSASASADVRRTSSGGGGGFWKRMTGGNKAPQPSEHKSFKEFEVEQDDAWGDEINQFDGLTFKRKTSVSQLSPSSSRPGSTDSGSSHRSSRSSSPGKQPRGKTEIKSPSSPAGPAAVSPGSSSTASKQQSGSSSKKRLSAILRPSDHRRSMSESSVVTQQGKPGQVQPSPDIDLIRREASAEAARVAKFKPLLESPRLDLDALRELSWSGIPHTVRPDTWRLLSGYLPANIDRRATTLERKRSEYRDFVEQYYGTRTDEGESQKTFHQIQIDIIRTNPTMPSFHNDITHQMFERILYIWALRHPASGYVQGINDLVTPFVSVFLSAFTGSIGQCDASVVTEEQRNTVEADAYWCLDKLLDGIQDHYTAGQPGIQKKIGSLKELAARVDANLHEHLGNNGVDYLTFSFRWMNCLLMREIPLRCTIRLWDTYHAEADGFASFHLYSCLAFLTTFKKELKAAKEFQDLIMLLQKPPTQNWTEKEIALLLAEAYSFKFMFHDAKKHLTQSQ